MEFADDGKLKSHYRYYNEFDMLYDAKIDFPRRRHLRALNASKQGALPLAITFSILTTFSKLEVKLVKIPI